MRTLKETVFRELETLQDSELKQVLDFIAFLKFRVAIAEKNFALAESSFQHYVKRCLPMEEEV